MVVYQTFALSIELVRVMQSYLSLRAAFSKCDCNRISGIPKKSEANPMRAFCLVALSTIAGGDAGWSIFLL